MSEARRDTPNPKFFIAKYGDGRYEKVFREPQTRFTIMGLLDMLQADPVAAQIGSIYVQARAGGQAKGTRMNFDSVLAVSQVFPEWAVRLDRLQERDNPDRDIVIGEHWISPFGPTTFRVDTVTIPYTNPKIEGRVVEGLPEAPTKIGRFLINEWLVWASQQTPPQ